MAFPQDKKYKINNLKSIRNLILLINYNLTLALRK